MPHSTSPTFHLSTAEYQAMRLLDRRVILPSNAAYQGRSRAKFQRRKYWED